jgi:hypothetical protein
MKRSDETLFDPRIAEWLEEDPNSAPSQTLDVVLAAFPSIKQRRGSPVPWRFPDMSSRSQIFAIAAAVVLAAVGGAYLLGPRIDNSIGVQPPSASAGQSSAPTSVPSAAPSPIPTSPAPTCGSLEGPTATPVFPDESPPPTDPPTLPGTTSWTNYQSREYGLCIGYPADWNVDPADGRWNLETDADDWLSPAMENFISPNGDVRVSVWSVPTTVDGFAPYSDVEEWISDYCARRGSASCNGSLSQAVELCVEIRDCHPGLLITSDEWEVQAFFTGGEYSGEMVVATVWRGESDASLARYGGGRRLLEAFIRTMGVIPNAHVPCSIADLRNNVCLDPSPRPT